jgi:hypothetical protein
MALFEEGNQAAAKGRKVEKMLERVLLQDDDKRLRQGLETVMDMFAVGERWAVEYVTDRLDGKAKQTVDANITGELLYSSIERTVIDPKE